MHNLAADTPRDELVEALGHLNREARRVQQIIGTDALPTRWDKLHGYIDHVLLLLEAR